MASLTAGDVEAHLAILTDDCIMMPPGDQAVVGHEAVRAWSEAFVAMFELSGEYTGSEIVVVGDWAIENYTAALRITPRDGGEAAMETIKGIHVYRRQADGSWKIAQDVWNSDAASM
jgi:ketosteroid isomerase-like protein